MDEALRWRGRMRAADAEAPREPEATAATGATAGYGDGRDAPVRVAVVGAPVESEMARDALAEAGIPAHIKGNSLGQIYGLSVGSFGAAEVWVPSPLAAQARDVLIGIGLLQPDDE